MFYGRVAMMEEAVKIRDLTGLIKTFCSERDR